MPDYTEEDVERAFQAYQNCPIDLCEDDEDNTRDCIRAVLAVMLPLAYTAGALAMKEAAIRECENRQAFCEALAEHDGLNSPDEDERTEATAQVSRWRAGRHSAVVLKSAIRALPVPPRGSKI